MTTCFLVSELGKSRPPAMVFPRAHCKRHIVDEAPTGTLGLANSAGRMTNTLFLEGMKHFLKRSNVSKEHPAFLILDNHKSHLFIPVIDLTE